LVVKSTEEHVSETNKTMTAIHTTRWSAPVQRILLAEDDDLSRKFLVALFTRMGYDVIATTTGTEAAEKLGREHIDMLVTDYQLPGLDGLHLLRTLRARDRSTPVILISGFLSDTVEQEARDAGVSAILRKPIDLPSLQERVTALLPPSAP
jgi:CheY-like chemotaxis protein